MDDPALDADRHAHALAWVIEAQCLERQYGNRLASQLRNSQVSMGDSFAYLIWRRAPVTSPLVYGIAPAGRVCSWTSSVWM